MFYIWSRRDSIIRNSEIFEIRVGLDLPLLCLEIEERKHKPRVSATSRNWENVSSWTAQDKSDASVLPLHERKFCQQTDGGWKWIHSPRHLHFSFVGSGSEKTCEPIGHLTYQSMPVNVCSLSHQLCSNVLSHQ